MRQTWRYWNCHSIRLSNTGKQ